MEETVKVAAAERALASPPLTVRELLRELADMLTAATDAGDPTDEASDIVAALVDEPRSWPALNGGSTAGSSLVDRARRAAAKRARGAPLAYCVGTAAFRHLTLEVDERVLVPRPETEQLVDVALSLLGSAAAGLAVDVGTGSGAIALALATESRFETVIGTDISADALAVARRNAERLCPQLRSRVEFRHGSLLAPLVGARPQLVTSNPPYIANPEAVELPRSVRDWEPPVALLSGEDGLHATARLVRQAAERLAPNGALVLEVDSRRAVVVAEMARRERRFTNVNVLPDLTGRERFVVAQRKEEE